METRSARQRRENTEKIERAEKGISDIQCIVKQAKFITTPEKAKKPKRETPDKAGQIVWKLRSRCIGSLDENSKTSDNQKSIERIGKEPRCIDKQTEPMIAKEKAEKRKHELVNQGQANLMQPHTCRDFKIVLDRNVVKTWLNDETPCNQKSVKNIGEEPRFIDKQAEFMIVKEKARKRKHELVRPDEAGRVVRQLRNRCIGSLDENSKTSDNQKSIDKIGEESRCIDKQTEPMIAKEKANKRKHEHVRPDGAGRVVRQLRNRCIGSLDDQHTNQDMDKTTTTTMQNTKEKRIARKSTKLTLKERISHDAPYKEYIVGEIVLATVVGYPPWPARIVDISGHTVKVEFFGTGEINPLRSSAINRFELNKTIPLLKRKDYAKAMRELEAVLGINKDHSVFTVRL